MVLPTPTQISRGIQLSDTTAQEQQLVDWLADMNETMRFLAKQMLLEDEKDPLWYGALPDGHDIVGKRRGVVTFRPSYTAGETREYWFTSQAADLRSW
jgi:hypothetical protein